MKALICSLLIFACLTPCFGATFFRGNSCSNIYQTSCATNYNTCYNTPVYNQEIISIVQKRVLYNTDYFLGTVGYYDVGQSYQNQAVLQKLQDLEVQNAEIKGQNGAILNIFGNKNPPNPSPVPTPNNPPVNPGQGTQLDQAVYQIFKNYNCADCHGANKNRGGLTLITADGALNKPPLAKMLKIYERMRGVNLGKGEHRMPLDGAPASDKDCETVFAWTLEEATNLMADNSN